jgi:hypothetical protein
VIEVWWQAVLSGASAVRKDLTLRVLDATGTNGYSINVIDCVITRFERPLGGEAVATIRPARLTGVVPPAPWNPMATLTKILGAPSNVYADLPSGTTTARVQSFESAGGAVEVEITQEDFGEIQFPTYSFLKQVSPIFLRMAANDAMWQWTYSMLLGDEYLNDLTLALVNPGVADETREYTDVFPMRVTLLNPLMAQNGVMPPAWDVTFTANGVQ